MSDIKKAIPVKKSAFQDFVRKYSLSKTLRFELRPLPETRPFLEEFVKSDTQRGKDYKELKQIIDEYHKDYITKSLSELSLLDIAKIRKLKQLSGKSKNLNKYEERKKIEKEMQKIQADLRKEITQAFKNQKELFGEKLIKKILPDWLDKKKPENFEGKKELAQKFSRFTTYLKGFHENRKNIYSSEEQATAISHRIINENLPKFFFNMNVYEKIQKDFPDLGEQIESLKSNLKKELDFLGIKSPKELFEIGFFSKCLSQEAIDSYNAIIGGKTTKEKHIQGINQKINLFRQQDQTEDKKTKKIRIMSQLYKQILSDSESHSFLPEAFESNQEFCAAIQNFWRQISEPPKPKGDSLLRSLENLFKSLSEDKNSMGEIYFSKNKLGDLSNKLFNDWRAAENALEDYSESPDADLKTKKEKESFLKQDFFSFQELHDALIPYKKEIAAGKGCDPVMDKIKEENTLLHYFKSLDFHLKSALEKTDRAEELPVKNLTVSSLITAFYDKAKPVLSNPPKENKKFNKEKIGQIKGFLDSVLELFHLIKPLYLEKDRKKLSDFEKDSDFYNKFEPLYEKLLPVISLYSKCRNYIASNKSRLKKIKINFEDNTLLNGWDLNKEADNLSVILRKKEHGKWAYYLGIMNKEKNRENRKLFDFHIQKDDSESKKQKKKKLKEKALAAENEEGYYEKMRYKQISDANKDIQTLLRINGKVCRKTKKLDDLRKDHLPSEIWKIKENESYSTGKENFSKGSLNKFIDYYKGMAKEYWESFNLSFKPSDEYANFKDFADHITSQGYKLSFDKIKEKYIEEKIKAGDLFLFRIYNKDFSKHSKSQPSLHTEYFRLLFEDANLKDTVFKLNGKAEIFYRKRSMEKKTVHVHPKNMPIKNKNPLNPKEKSEFDYDIIKNKRFTEDKFFFHVPITLNFKEKDMKMSYQFNQGALKFLKGNKNINIIGIDRGERHLAYYTVINQSGEILEQGSFNTISSEYKKKGAPAVKVKTDYHRLLEARETERDRSRKSWGKIENIKELKSGYLSHLVHQISRLMIKHNAIAVFEDLNKGFKRSRMKFEKQIYQKLEKALIDKLNYLVFKDEADYSGPGGFLNGYQLAAPFESFQKLRQQTGFVFYTPAYYTSKVCPLTGFANLVYPCYKNVKKSKEFFKAFESIYFDSKAGYFVFKYNDGKVNSRKKSESSASWEVCSHGEERYKYDVRNKKHIKVNVTEALKNLFEKYEIKYQEEKNMIESICRQDKKDFWSELIPLFKLTLQLRHVNPEAKTDAERDYILSPVADKSGRFFDSRKAAKSMPQNADANGAYHIALKGLKTLQDLDQQKTDKLKVKPISNKDWFDFIRKEKEPS